MEKSINDQTKMAISLAKILPIIFLLISIKFMVFGLLILSFWYRDFFFTITCTIFIGQLIAFLSFRKKTKSENHIKSVVLEFLILSVLLELSGLSKINLLENVVGAVFIFTSSIFFIWTLIVGILRINVLSNIGFSIFTSISFTTLMMTPRTSWDVAIIFFSSFICIFLWTIKVRKACLRNSQLEPEDFSFSFGYKKGSTGLVNIK